jgi:2-polyprenyl-6-methoxyphenol hydroxylase-like FAD-dependent oxidoreductase
MPEPGASRQAAEVESNMLKRVLVVGGGIAGTCCAIQLRKAGIAVDLVEIDPHWGVLGAGLTITGPTLRALHTIGVLDEVKALGATWSGGKAFNQQGELLTEIHTEPLSPELPATAGILRPQLHKVLAERTRASGTQVRLGVTVNYVSIDDEQAEVVFSDGREARYDLVVAADGIHSKLRTMLFPDAPKPHFTGQVVYRMIATRPAEVDRSYFYMGRDIKIGFNPISSTQMYMFLLHPSPSNPWVDAKDQPSRLHAAMEGFGGIVPAIRETVLGENAATINYRPLEVLLLPRPWTRGRVVLIGDTSHATTPHLASGAGMAIEDGIVLTEELHRQTSVLEALAAFEERRFERCAMTIHNSVRLGQLEMTHASPVEHGKLMADSLKLLRAPI